MRAARLLLLLLLLLHAGCRRLKMVFDDGLALVDAHVVELAQLLLDHPQVVLCIRVENPTVFIGDNNAVIQILAMILVEFCSLLFA